MGRGTYLGGSTLLGRRPGSVGVEDSTKPGQSWEQRRIARAKRLAEAAARKAKRMKIANPAPKSSSTPQKRAERRMIGVEVLKRTRDGKMIVLRPGKAPMTKPSPSARPRLRLRPPGGKD